MPQIETKNVNFYYGKTHALHNINLDIEKNSVTAFIGPSGCGKSTLLRLYNRMNDLIPNTKLEGNIIINNKNIFLLQFFFNFTEHFQTFILLLDDNFSNVFY